MLPHVFREAPLFAFSHYYLFRTPRASSPLVLSHVTWASDRRFQECPMRVVEAQSTVIGASPVYCTRKPYGCEQGCVFYYPTRSFKQAWAPLQVPLCLTAKRSTSARPRSEVAVFCSPITVQQYPSTLRNNLSSRKFRMLTLLTV
jgi:hypothetical protein